MLDPIPQGNFFNLHENSAANRCEVNGVLVGTVSTCRIYEGWFDNAIISQATTATKTALKDGVNNMELIYPAVPNLEVGSYDCDANDRCSMMNDDDDNEEEEEEEEKKKEDN